MIERLTALAQDAGFSLVGITSPMPQDAAAYPEGSIIVLALPYADSPPEGFPQVHISSYYWWENRAYHAAGKMAQALRCLDPEMTAHLRLNHRAYAKRAGLGRHGRNGLLHNQVYGSRVLLQLLHTRLELPLTGEHAVPGDLHEACAGCARCVDACPTGALDGEGNLEASRCLRNWMNTGQPVPQEYRRLMRNCLQGCEICQRACPDAVPEPKSLPLLREKLCLDDWMTCDDAVFSQRVKELGALLGSNSMRGERLKAQLALLAGNRGDPKDIEVLRHWASTCTETVADHAQWAISQIQGGDAHADSGASEQNL